MTDVRETGLNVFGRLWGRDGLSRRDRSLVTLGMLIAMRANDELALHFRIARTNGLTDDEIAEVIYHSSGYAGFPGRRDRQQDRRRDSERLTAARGPRGCANCRRNAACRGADTHARGKGGATWGNRTPDLFITSESLYRLS